MKDGPGEVRRQQLLAKHTERIRKEIAEINALGLSAKNHIYQDVLEVKAGRMKARDARRAGQ